MLIKKWINTFKINGIEIEIFKNPIYNDIIDLLKNNRNSGLLCKNELRGFINIYSLNYYIWVAEKCLHKNVIKKIKNYNEENCISFLFNSDLNILLLSNENMNKLNQNKCLKIISILKQSFKNADLIME